MITITGSAKEIAALADELQERRVRREMQGEIRRIISDLEETREEARPSSEQSGLTEA